MDIWTYGPLNFREVKENRWIEFKDQALILLQIDKTNKDINDMQDSTRNHEDCFKKKLTHNMIC